MDPVETTPWEDVARSLEDAVAACGAAPEAAGALQKLRESIDRCKADTEAFVNRLSAEKTKLDELMLAQLEVARATRETLARSQADAARALDTASATHRKAVEELEGRVQRRESRIKQRENELVAMQVRIDRAREENARAQRELAAEREKTAASTAELGRIRGACGAYVAAVWSSLSNTSMRIEAALKNLASSAADLGAEVPSAAPDTPVVAGDIKDEQAAVLVTLVSATECGLARVCATAESLAAAARRVRSDRESASAEASALRAETADLRQRYFLTLGVSIKQHLLNLRQRVDSAGPHLGDLFEEATTVPVPVAEWPRWLLKRLSGPASVSAPSGPK